MRCDEAILRWTSQVEWGGCCIIAPTVCGKGTCVRQFSVESEHILLHFCHWQEHTTHYRPCSLCPSSSWQLPDSRRPMLWPPRGNKHYLVLCAWLRTVRSSRLSCCWCSRGLWSPQSLDCWVLLTAAVPHPGLTSKLQQSPDGAQKVPTQGAQMLLTALLTCLYSIPFPYGGTRGCFSWTFQGCLNFVMIFLLWNFLLKPRALSKAFIDSRRDARREVLPTTKQVLCHWFDQLK